MTEKKINYLGWTVAIAGILTQIITAVWLIATMNTTIQRLTSDANDLKTDYKEQQREITNIELFDGIKKR